MLVGTTTKNEIYLSLSLFTLNWMNAILFENLLKANAPVTSKRFRKRLFLQNIYVGTLDTISDFC